MQTVVLAAPLAGMLAHEAMGHPCEADAVIGGAVTASLVGQPVASELVSMIDFAHTYGGESTLIPVEVDDEGTPGRDVVMIERGILTSFMHSRETAARMEQAPTGNARAYNPHDEPLVRMRNTAILPGTSTMDEMIAGVDDGYLLLKTGNGQADSTTEFTFGITLAYEIRNGKLGRAVRNTTLSGSAIKVLKTVDAVGDTMHWELRRLLRQEAADGGVDGRAGAARTRAPGRRMNTWQRSADALCRQRRAGAGADAPAGLRPRAGARASGATGTSCASRTTMPACCAAPHRTSFNSPGCSMAVAPTPTAASSMRRACRRSCTACGRAWPPRRRTTPTPCRPAQSAQVARGPQQA